MALNKSTTGRPGAQDVAGRMAKGGGEVKEHPILFSTPMVRAILEGRKTQTRRVMKGVDSRDRFMYGTDGACGEAFFREHPLERLRSKYGCVGDMLWVRETWRNHAYPLVFPSFTRYAADNIVADVGKGPWRPSIHMPRWASRITLEITDVRVQRVEEISEEDAIAEGVTFDGKYWHGAAHVVKGVPRCMVSATDAFMDIWYAIYFGRVRGWDANPWVWAITFRRV